MFIYIKMRTKQHLPYTFMKYKKTNFTELYFFLKIFLVILKLVKKLHNREKM